MSTILGSEGGTTAPAAPATGNQAPTNTSDTKTWHSSLPEDIRENPMLKNFKDIPDLAKSYIHAQQMIGKKGHILPTEKSSAEEWNALYKAIGMPDKDKYEIKTPEGKQVNQEIISKFKELAVENGILPKQAQKMIEWYISQEEATLQSKIQEMDNGHKEQLAALQKEWGQGFDKNVSLAKLAVSDLGGDEFKSYLDETGLGNDPMLIKMLAKAGKLLGEDKIRGNSTGKFGQTPEEINTSIASINANPGYWDRSSPEYPRLKAEMEKLMKAAYGSK